jgi:hypothetical protein
MARRRASEVKKGKYPSPHKKENENERGRWSVGRYYSLE